MIDTVLKPWHGIDHQEIDWQPTVEFPGAGSIRQLIKPRKLLRMTKDQLKAERIRYDVATY